MPEFFALVDALPGREADVEAALRSEKRLLGVVRCKEKSADFLIRFDAPAFEKVDDLLQTHVRAVKGVAGVEIVTDWDDYSATVRQARAALR